MTLEPSQSKTFSVTLDSWNYERKITGLSFVKITTSGFVQETGQSYADEQDFIFNKPSLEIKVSHFQKRLFDLRTKT